MIDDDVAAVFNEARVHHDDRRVRRAVVVENELLVVVVLVRMVAVAVRRRWLRLLLRVSMSVIAVARMWRPSCPVRVSALPTRMHPPPPRANINNSSDRFESEMSALNAIHWNNPYPNKRSNRVNHSHRRGDGLPMPRLNPEVK